MQESRHGTQSLMTSDKVDHWTPSKENINTNYWELNPHTTATTTTIITTTTTTSTTTTATTTTTTTTATAIVSTTDLDLIVNVYYKLYEINKNVYIKYNTPTSHDHDCHNNDTD